MGLGYALLHPSRTALALEADQRQILMDDASDIVLSAMSGADLTQGLSTLLAAARGQVSAVEGAVGGLGSPSGPFGPILGLFGPLPSGLPDLDALLGRLATFLETINPAGMGTAVEGWLDRLLGALPGADGGGFAKTVAGLMDAALSGLESPFLGGQRDPAASRSYRAAVLLRSYIEGLFTDLDAALSGFSLKGAILPALRELLTGIDAPILAQIAASLRTFQGTMGPLLRALHGVSASLSVTVTAGGPNPEPGSDPTWRDDGNPTPHGPGHFLFWVDFGTNLLSLFNLLWEMIRTASWHRPLEVITSVLQIGWQITRTIVRLDWKTLNGWSEGARFWFTDLGDFLIHIVLRTLMSLHDLPAKNNWALSAGVRILKHYASVLSPRMFYLYLRSHWYLLSWKGENRDAQGHLKSDAQPLSFVRLCWAMWPVQWAVGALFSVFQKWENFNLSFSVGPALWLATSVAVGVGLSLVVMNALTGGVFDFDLSADTGLLVFWLIASCWLVFVTLMVITSVNKFQRLPWYGWVGLSLVFLAMILPAIGVLADPPRDAAGNAIPDRIKGGWGGYMAIFHGVVGFGLMGFVLWWYFVDDGRDKGDRFAGLDVGTAPYRLPYPADETWLCGQGVHGIFSHLASSPFNHYSWDFNNDENKPGAAARTGIVVQTQEIRVNGGDDANSLIVQHLDWVPGHDPGSDKERVLTYANYWHLSKGHVWASPGQRVPRGYQAIDIDDTGESAQHHLHLCVTSPAVGLPDSEGNENYQDMPSFPVLFGDASVRGFRNYPLLAWIPGHGRIAGKPIALAYYKSENAAAPVSPMPRTVYTQSQGGHTHGISLGPDLFPGAALPTTDPVVLWTSVANGHRHRLSLPLADFHKLVERRPLDGLQTEETRGHRHPLESDPHLLGTETPTFGRRANVRVTVQHAPSGQILARAPGPYDLRGERMVLRVDDRETHVHLFGVQRASVRADVAVDQAPGEADRLEATSRGRSAMIATGATVDPAGLGPAPGVRRALRQINAGLAAAGSPVRLRAEAALALETAVRGANAQISISSGPAAEKLGFPATQTASGSGAVSNATVPRADLASLVGAALNAGWPAAPANLTHTPRSPALPRGALAQGTTPVTFAGSTERIATVLAAAYRTPAGAAPTLDVDGSLPLGSGRVVLVTSAGALLVPLLARPARLEIDPTHAALVGDAMMATPLKIKLRATDPFQEITLNTVPDLAEQITAQIEGLRAWISDQGKLELETVAAGADVVLTLEKDGPTPADKLAPPTATGAGAPLGLAIPTPGIADTGRVPLEILDDAIQDAIARGRDGANPHPITAEITADNRLRLRGTDPATQLTVRAAEPLHFQAVPGSPGQVQTDPLPDLVPLNGDLWIDVDDNFGRHMRAALDNAPARLQGGPIRALPEAGDTLELNVQGRAVSIAFTSAPSTVEGLIMRIAHEIHSMSIRIGSDALIATVRPAWFLVFDSLPLNAPLRLEVPDATGAALAGFLGPAPRFSIGWGHADDPDRVPAAFPDPAVVLYGSRYRGLEIAEDGDRLLIRGGTGQRLSLVPMTADDGGLVDPLQLQADPASANVLRSAPLGSPLDLGRTAFGYRIQVREGETAIAEACCEISASPAVLRTKTPPDLTALPANPDLTVRVERPDGAGGTAASQASLSMSGCASLAEAAERFNAAQGLVRSWVTRIRRVANPLRDAPPPAPQPYASSTPYPTLTDSDLDVLVVETLAGGTGVTLRLEGEDTLVALGFDPRPAAGGTAFQAQGRGDMALGSAATKAELRAALTSALLSATRIDRPAPEAAAVPGGASPFFQVNVGAARLELAATGKAVTVTTAPAGLAARLAITAGTATTPALLAPTAPVALTHGVVSVSVDGALAAAAELWGNRATISSPDPLPTDAASVRATLSALAALSGTGGQAVAVRVDGGPAVAVAGLPAAPATLFGDRRDYGPVLARLAEQVPAAWFGVVDQGGRLFLRVQSRTRGSRSAISFDLSGVPTTATALLGFPVAAGHGTSAADVGAGSVPDLDAVTLQDLSRVLDEARGRGASSAAGLTATVTGAAATARIQVQGGPGTALLQEQAPSAAPGSMAFPGGPSGTLSTPYPGTREMLPGILALTLQAWGAAPTRLGLRTLLWGEPARQTLTPPASLGSLTGKRLTLSIQGTAQVFTFPALASPAALAAFLERQSNTTLRVRITGATLTVETVREGTSARLAVQASGASDAAPLLGLATLPPAASGDGNVADLAAVSAAEVQGAIATWTSRGLALPGAPVASALPLAWRGCLPADDADEVTRGTLDPAPRTGGLPTHLQLRSGRVGCRSAVVPLIAPAALALERSLARAPAVRGSITSQPLASPTRLSGDLMLLCDEFPSDPAFLPSAQVKVSFEDRDWSAEEIADQIHEALSRVGHGSAAAFPDGVVVIESSVDGIAGAIAALPSALGSTASVVTALFGSDARVEGRGWPGAGRASTTDGFRSQTSGSPVATTSWRFRTDRDPTAAAALEADLTINAGETADTLAQRLHQVLGTAHASGGGPATRIGAAVKGPDGAVYIEATVGQSLFLYEVNGQRREALESTPPQPGKAAELRPVTLAIANPRLGAPWEVPDEPGFGLRRTNQARTVRLARGFGGRSPADGLVADIGWVRVPADRGGLPRGWPHWPDGRALLSLRTEGSKQDDYAAAGDLVASLGQAEGRSFAHRVRYWLDLSGFVEDWSAGAGNHANYWSRATGDLSAAVLGWHPLGTGAEDLALELLSWW